jgi:uncharacterized membrane protein YesL
MTLLGGVIFGVIPATVVVCVMTRRYLNGVSNITAGVMFTQFKKEFIRCNKSGLLMLVPLLALVWWSGWLVNNTNGLVSVAALAMIPVAALFAALLYGTLVQMSLYQTTSVWHDIENGLQFIFGQGKTFMASVLVLVSCVAIAQLMPILALFFYVSPALITAVFLTWQNNTHLQDIDMETV